MSLYETKSSKSKSHSWGLHGPKSWKTSCKESSDGTSVDSCRRFSKNPFPSSHKSQEESRGAPEALSIIMPSWPGERESQKPCIKSSTRTVRERGPKACRFSCVLCRSASPLAIRLAYLVRYRGCQVWRSAISSSSSSSVRGRPLRFFARYRRFWAATRSGCLAR